MAVAISAFCVGLLAGAVTVMTPSRFAAFERSSAVGAEVMSACRSRLGLDPCCSQVRLAPSPVLEPIWLNQNSGCTARRYASPSSMPSTERAGSAGRTAGERQSPMCARWGSEAQVALREGSLPRAHVGLVRRKSGREAEQNDCKDQREPAAHALHAADSGTRRELRRSFAASSPTRTRPTASRAQGGSGRDRLDALLRRLRARRPRTRRTRSGRRGWRRRRRPPAGWR